MELRTLVTGSNGRVGRVLRERLSDLPMTFAGHHDLDVTDRVRLQEAMARHDQIIHLASPLSGNAWLPTSLSASVDMVRQILEVARASGMNRLIIPSSISTLHTDQLSGRDPVTIANSRPAESPYGRSRLEIEELCRAATAENGLEVICLRLGMVRHPDAPLGQEIWRPHWLSHEDCASLFRACSIAPLVPGRFSLFYAVSDLPTRTLDVSNPFGWAPRTKALGFRRSSVAWVHRINTAVRGRLRLGTRLRDAAKRLRG